MNHGSFSSAASMSRRSRSASPERVSPSAPLGISVEHSHYIQPVPPTYVTEYESAFLWPPDIAYSPANSPGRRPSTESSTALAWLALEQSLTLLRVDAPEVVGDEGLLEVVKRRRLHASIEDAVKKVHALVNNAGTSEAARNQCREFLKNVSILKGD